MSDTAAVKTKKISTRELEVNFNRRLFIGKLSGCDHMNWNHEEITLVSDFGTEATFHRCNSLDYSLRISYLPDADLIAAVPSLKGWSVLLCRD